MSIFACFGIFAIIWLLYIFYVSGHMFKLGSRAMQLAGYTSGEQQQTLRYLMLNLYEPLVVMGLIIAIVILGFILTAFRSTSSGWLILWLPYLLHAGMLLWPLGGFFANNLYYRELNRNILAHGLGRLGCTIAIYLPFFIEGADPKWLFMPIGLLVGTILLWRSRPWGETMLAGPLGQLPMPAPKPIPVVPQPVASAARVAAATPQPTLIESGPLIYCPLCHAPTRLSDESCDACGLLFRSRIPAALQGLRRYRVLRPLGDGGMSSVFLARDLLHGRLCVIKALVSVDGLASPERRADAAACLVREADLLARINHPRVVHLIEHGSEGLCDFLALEYINGPTLEQQLSRTGPNGVPIPGAALPPHKALAYATSVAEIMGSFAELSRPVLHLDIKPSNLILPPDSRHPVLVDFGGAILLSRHEADPTRITARLDTFGTPGYAAPEQYRGRPDPRSDVYGLGATLYHLLSDDDPAGHPLSFPALTRLPTDIAGLLGATLAREPDARPAAAELLDELRRLAGKYSSQASHQPLDTPLPR